MADLLAAGRPGSASDRRQKALSLGNSLVPCPSARSPRRARVDLLMALSGQPKELALPLLREEATRDPTARSYWGKGSLARRVLRPVSGRLPSAGADQDAQSGTTVLAAKSQAARVSLRPLGAEPESVRCGGPRSAGGAIAQSQIHGCHRGGDGLAAYRA